jgi:hypothetical protein
MAFPSIGDTGIEVANRYSADMVVKVLDQQTHYVDGRSVNTAYLIILK